MLRINIKGNKTTGWIRNKSVWNDIEITIKFTAGMSNTFCIKKFIRKSLHQNWSDSRIRIF